jgi:folate-binding protein YgfZ
MKWFELTDTGLISVEGADSAGLLQGQLTQDVAGMAPGSMRLAGYCNPKGRLFATFGVARLAADRYVFVLPRNNAGFLAKRLSMFVLRAKAKVVDESASWVLFGLQFAGAAPTQIAGLAIPAAGHASASDAGLAISRAVGDLTQVTLAAPASSAEALRAELAAQFGPAASLQEWHASRIAAAQATVDERTREAFVPQMINFELVGGVNFKKGCYPGQEVVARSQYLGKLKRRMGLAHVAAGADVAPLSDVLVDAPAQAAAEPVGTVVEAASMADGSWLVLFEAPLAAQEAGNLKLADGRSLSLQPLPYEIIDITA